MESTRQNRRNNTEFWAFRYNQKHPISHILNRKTEKTRCGIDISDNPYAWNTSFIFEKCKNCQKTMLDQNSKKFSDGYYFSKDDNLAHWISTVTNEIITMCDKIIDDPINYKKATKHNEKCIDCYCQVKSWRMDE